ncbi:MAG: 50S ribosomal protein L10 [DPANN group archaeon]|nr:50S ribosomal protein L10 [DPANN group archaeon]
MRKEPKVAEWKASKVEQIKKAFDAYKTSAIIDVSNLPARELQKVRKKLRGAVDFVFAKKILILKAIEQSKNAKIKELAMHIGKEPALMFTNKGAFELFRSLKENRQAALAKPGQTSPSDIYVEAGPTPFTPGPVLTELAQLKIKAKVVGGKIEIQQRALLVKKSDAITQQAASMLAKLGVTPMEIGVNLIAALEGQDLYPADVLDIDAEKFIEQIKQAYVDALKLGIGREIMTKEVAEYLLGKAEREAKAVEKLVNAQPAQAGG